MNDRIRCHSSLFRKQRRSSLSLSCCCCRMPIATADLLGPFFGKAELFCSFVVAFRYCTIPDLAIAQQLDKISLRPVICEKLASFTELSARWVLEERPRCFFLSKLIKTIEGRSTNLCVNQEPLDLKCPKRALKMTMLS